MFDLYYLLKFKNTEVVQRLGSFLREKLYQPGAGQRWEEPEDWHITLLYVSSEDADSIAALAANSALLELPDLRVIETDGVGQFDTKNDGYALFLNVKETPELDRLQGLLLAYARGHLVDISTLSANWIPHITLAYASQPFTDIPVVITNEKDNREPGYLPPRFNRDLVGGVGVRPSRVEVSSMRGLLGTIQFPPQLDDIEVPPPILSDVQ